MQETNLLTCDYFWAKSSSIHCNYHMVEVLHVLELERLLIEEFRTIHDFPQKDKVPKDVHANKKASNGLSSMDDVKTCISIC